MSESSDNLMRSGNALLRGAAASLRSLLPICIVIVGVALASDDIGITKPLDDLSGPARIFKERDCFARSFGNYEEWIGRLHGLNRNRERSFFENRFPQQAYELYKRDLDCRFFLYDVGELVIEGYYVRPKNLGDESLPVILTNRGGNGRYGRVNFGSLFLRTFPLASSGFIVVGSQYRGGGIPADEGDNGQDEFGGKDVNDVLALFELIDEMPNADSTRIGMMGWSRGGFMTFITATKTARLRAIAVGGTPTDFAAELVFRPEMERVFQARIADYEDNKDAALAARSALRWADRIEAGLPTLILHGASDKRVSLDGAVKIAEILHNLDHPTKLVIYEDGSHGLIEYNEEVMHELVTWFKIYLTDE